MKQKNKRRRYPIVNKSHQYRFLAMILIYNMIIVAFLVTALLVPNIIQLQDQSLSLEVRAAAADKILIMHSRVWPAIIAIICLIGLHSFRVFHRFVGPLYRFCWAFEQVRNGDLSFRVKLRKKDYLHQEEEVLNSMLEMLAEKMESVQLASIDASKSLNEVEQKVTEESDLSETSKELLRIHRQHLDEMIDTAGYFRPQKTEQEHCGAQTDQVKLDHAYQLEST